MNSISLINGSFIENWETESILNDSKLDYKKLRDELFRFIELSKIVSVPYRPVDFDVFSRDDFDEEWDEGDLGERVNWENWKIERIVGTELYWSYVCGDWQEPVNVIFKMTRDGICPLMIYQNLHERNKLINSDEIV